MFPIPICGVVDIAFIMLYNIRMNVKDVIEIDIESSGMDGEGVARYDGKVVFVPYTLQGERVRAVVKSVKKNYATASVIKILSPSPSRVEPDCPHYYKCGGCDTRHLSDDYRRAVLVGELENNLKKIAGLSVTPTEFVSSSTPRRNKIAMPFGCKDGHVVLGMYRKNSHVVEPVDCLFASERMREVVRTVCEFADEYKLPAYDERSSKGLLRHLVMREAGERLSVALVVAADGFEGESVLSGRLPSFCDFFICPNTAKNNVIMGSSARLVKGNERLKVNVLGVSAELSPLSFFQVNDEIRDRLYLDAIGEMTAPTLVDLYSGIGITSNLAARKCDKVYGVECVPQAVVDADRTAAANGNADKIINTCGDVEKVLPMLGISGDMDILVDPPRKGCGAPVMTEIAKLRPSKLIYISCNHATMCRDIRIFLDAVDGYSLTACRVYDMFPCTHHVETLCVLSK